LRGSAAYPRPGAPQRAPSPRFSTYQGVSAPARPEKPTARPLLFGISGGAAAGYFFFAYENLDPQVNILTRNTFGDYGWATICQRLGISQDEIRSTTEAKAEAKLIEVLEQGRAPAVWADVFTLGYEFSDLGPDMWAVQPVVVGAYPEGGWAAGGEAMVSDRSEALHRCPAEVLHSARGRIKKDRYLMVCLDDPDAAALPGAVRAGIRDAAALFFDKPPKGSANNFGYKALTRLSADVASIKGKGAWNKLMSEPRQRLAGRMSAFRYGHLFWKDESLAGDRLLFADFLDEAAAILEIPALAESAGEYRRIAGLWQDLAELWLPSDIPLCAEAAEVIRGRHSLFRRKGLAARAELAELDARRTGLLERAQAGELELGGLKDSAAAASDLLLRIRDREARALRSLSDLIS
jgi:hypothetical protein